MIFRAARVLVLTTALGLLAACESDEDKADRFYQSALSYMESGDIDRALIELRNVFNHDGFHREARQLYADTLVERGDVTEAYSQYLRLVEQYPNAAAARLALAELAVARSDWAEVERHGTAAIEIIPEDPRARLIAAALDYRDAVLAGDTAARAEAAETIGAIMEADLPDSAVARVILVDQAASGPDPRSALPILDAAIAAEPENFSYHALRAQILSMPDEEGNRDAARLDAVLAEMSAQFPDNREVIQTRLDWLISQGDLDGAEALLRGAAGPDDGPVEDRISVVQFLARLRGPEAARAELEGLVAANEGNENARFYRVALASLDLEEGHAEEAISATRAALEEAPPGSQTQQLRLALAGMLEISGDRAGAEAVIEEVLAEDSTNVEALILRARWHLQDGNPDAALTDLRLADSQSARNPAILTLMAEAHDRTGDRDLALQRLSLAVEASNRAPETSLRYATRLAGEGRVDAALAILRDARAANPGDLAVLGGLVNIYLSRQSWPELQEILSEAQRLGTPEAEEFVRNLQTAVMLAQSQTEDSLAFLEEEIREGADEDRTRAMMAVIQIRAGNLEGARALIDEQLSQAPGNPVFLGLSADLHAMNGNIDAAVTDYRALIAADPGNDDLVRLLYGLLTADGKMEEAAEVLKAGLEAIPESATLRWIEAGRLERAGDFDGAIALYEELHAEDSGNMIAINNLASLIASHRTAPAEIARAVTLARPLRGLDVPAFQDTWGWLQYLDGNPAEALPALRAAAEGLPEEPQVLAHLGLVEAALGRAEAEATLTAALERAGDSPLDLFDEVRAALAGMGSGANAGTNVPEAAPDSGAGPEAPEAEESNVEPGPEEEAAAGAETGATP